MDNTQLNVERIRACDEDAWRTINGAKVLIDGESGTIKGGAGGKFTGQKFGKKSVSKAGALKKVAESVKQSNPHKTMEESVRENGYDTVLKAYRASLSAPRLHDVVVTVDENGKLDMHHVGHGSVDSDVHDGKVKEIFRTRGRREDITRIMRETEDLSGEPFSRKDAEDFEYDAFEISNTPDDAIETFLKHYTQK